MRVLLAILVSCFALFGRAQGVLTGKVSAMDDGKALFTANVYIPELYKGASVEEDGSYRIEHIPKGTFSVQFSFVGYETIVKQVKIDGEEATLDAQLDISVIEGHEMVISSGYPTSQDESPVKIEQISASTISQSGSPSLMESLTSMPGVNMVSTGAGVGKPVIRGLSYNRVLVYSQGVRIENQQWGDEHGLGLSAMGIDRVEIIKGPSSLLYGSDAMGGVMHLIEEKPATVGAITSDYNVKAFSNTLGYNTNLGFKGTGKRVRFGLRAGIQSHADYTQGNGQRVTNSRFQGEGVKSSLGFNTKWVTSTLAYNMIHSNIGLPEAATVQETIRKPELPNQDITSHIASWQNTFYMRGSKLKANLGYVLNQRKEFEDAEIEDEHEHEHAHDVSEEPALNMELATGNYDVKWYLPPMKHAEFVLGVQGMNQTNTNSGAELLIPNATVNDIGAAAMAKVELKETTLQGGVRFDNRAIATSQMGAMGDMDYFPAVSRSFNSFNGALGATFHMGHKLHLRTNIASGFRAPNLAELTSNGVHHGTNRFEAGNGNLASEQNLEGDISAHLHTKHVTADIAGYYNNIWRYIFLMPTDSVVDNAPYYFYTQSNARLYGGEATLDIHPHPWDWLHIESVYGIVIGEREDGTPLPLIPAGKLTNTLKAELEEWKALSEAYLMVGHTTIFGQLLVSKLETTTGAYNLWKAGLGTNIKLLGQQTELTFTVNNLFDAAYVDHLSRLKYNGIYNMGRNFSFSLKVPFGLKK